MYNELSFSIANEKHRAFFMNGFLSSSKETASNLHKHNFSEIHFITGGNASFLVSENKINLQSGHIMIIPQGEFHCCIQKDTGVFHNAFQVDFDVRELRTADIGNGVISNLFSEIESLKKTGDYAKVSAYVSLFCSYLCPESKSIAEPVSDYGFIIQEFISTNYNKKIKLSDLAKELHLSERQTERLVRKHTGGSFKDEVRKIRINVANQLLASSDMTLSEVSEYVGYESYSGFWKAQSGQADGNFTG